jgi:GMP synthase (glutamine-hydrolysing)
MGDATDAKKQKTAHAGHSTVVILDYGSQYSQLITRRVREIGVFSVMLPGDADMVRERAEQERAR